MDVEKPVIRFDIREELHALAIGAIGVGNRDKCCHRRHRHEPGMPDRPGDEAHVEAVAAAVLLLSRGAR